MATHTSPTTLGAHHQVVNADTGEVYYSKAHTTLTNNASVTKMMTMLVLFDHYSSRAALAAQSATVLAGDVQGGTGGNSCNSGDIQTLDQLAAAAMLPSSNTAAYVIARVIGDKIYTDAGSTGTQGVTRFVEAMNAKAAAIGMTNTTYTTPSGDETSHDVTAEDVAILCTQAALLDNAVLQEIMRVANLQHTIDRGGSLTIGISSAAGPFNIPGYRMLKGGIGGGNHRFVAVEMPNGQRVVFIVLNGASVADAEADIFTLYNQLLIDESATLAVSGTPYTPDFTFTGLTAGGACWSPASAKFQDDGGVTPAGTGDVVGRINPEYAGTAGQYLRQATASRKPILQADGSVLGDGTDDFISVGAASIGATGLFCDAGQEFMVGVRLKTSDGSGTIIAKGSGNQNSRTFHVYLNGASQSPDTVIRGSTTSKALAINSGNEETLLWHWDGATLYEDMSDGLRIKDPGAVADQTSEEIMLLARTIASPAFPLNGQIYTFGIVDKFDWNHYVRFREWVRGNEVNEFRDPAGTAPSNETAAITGTIDESTETQIRDGGRTIIITLTDDTWVAAGATFDAQRQAIIDGITSAESETNGWNNQVRDNEVVGAVVRTSDAVVTITLSAAASYQITATENITVTVPASALVTRATALVATPAVQVQPNALSVTVGGSVVGAYENEVVAGPLTLALTLNEGETFIAAGTGPIGSTAQSQAIIDGITSAQVEAGGWNAQIRDVLVPATHLARTSDTTATLTIPATAGYSITGNESITPTIPASVLTVSASPLVGPAFSINEGERPSAGFTSPVVRGITRSITHDATNIDSEGL